MDPYDVWTEHFPTDGSWKEHFSAEYEKGIDVWTEHQVPILP